MKVALRLGLFLLLLSSCEAEEKGLIFEEKGRSVPSFSADSAYSFTQAQVQIGPRYPNSEGQKAVQDYLKRKLKTYAGAQMVFSQDFTAEGYNGEELRLSNIIASFNPTAADRIMLAAHYDTRPRAEEDPENPENPILGADDGGSGTGVILELARLFSIETPPVGVDVILFDGEDYGESGDLDNYFLGSRYWAENPPVPGYKPRFGILLDMVGGEGAVFPKEQYSMTYAPNLVDEIWSIAAEKGYDDFFLDEDGAGVVDDHVIINRVSRIPFIDIIYHRRNDQDGADFAPYWHTMDDNMDIISRKTLNAVGEVLAELIYNRI